MASYQIPGLPDYSKMFATGIGAGLGLAVYHPSLLFRISLRPTDLPVLVWCLCPLASSLFNGLGPYDGISAVVHQSITWGLPYFIGRVVYRTPRELVPLGIAIIVCGLIYVPLCMWEIRMSPQLHATIYGYHQHSFAQTMRFGGWRPTVFMQHGLQVALWTACCLIISFTTWWAGAFRTWRGLPTWPILLLLAMTLVLSKSLGAWMLAFVAVSVIVLCQQTKTVIAAVAIAAVVPAYFVVRTSGVFTGDTMVQLVSDYVSPDKAASLAFRLKNEDMLIDKALAQPVFGWGGWGRNRVFDEYGVNQTVTDGLWIITLGINGVVGLGSLYAMLLTGPVSMIRRSKPQRWRKQPELVFAFGLSLVCILHAIDSLPNAMVIPVFVVATGAITSAAHSKSRRDERPCPERSRQSVLRGNQLTSRGIVGS